LIAKPNFDLRKEKTMESKVRYTTKDHAIRIARATRDRQGGTWYVATKNNKDYTPLQSRLYVSAKHGKVVGIFGTA
jgi:hypothetical protein